MAMESRTTIALKISAKDRLDVSRAPGQCYDGFISQLMDLWEETRSREYPYSPHPVTYNRKLFRASIPIV
jgi:hypothetical protein